MKNKKVALVGLGFVGKAMLKLFPDAIIYDRYLNGGIGNMSKVNEAGVAFIAVPTPLKEDGRLDISIVEDTISKCECDLIVLRSTVNPGDCDKFEKKYNKNILMVPEYVGETVSHPLLDESKRGFLIIGGRPENRRKLIELFTTVYNSNITIRQVSNLEAEVIKLSENRAITFKMMQIQELYDVCEKAGVDYYVIREAVYGDDPRFNLWFSFIYPDKRGFNNSKCLVKDVPAFCAWAESVGYDAKLTKALVERSNEYEDLSNGK
jgi:UDP-glucose 6-dehydrogenase